MTTPAITVGPEMTFPDIVDVLLHNDVSGLPVVDENNYLLGVVTEADLMSKAAYGFTPRRPLALLGAYLRGEDPQWVRKAAAQTAGELMTQAPMTAHADETVASAAQRMLLSHYKRLPVVEHGKVVGVVTRRDLLTLFHRTDEDLQSELDELFSSPIRVPETHNARVFVQGGVVTLEGDVEFPMDAVLLGAVAAKVVGVVAVDNRLKTREPDDPKP